MKNWSFQGMTRFFHHNIQMLWSPGKHENRKSRKVKQLLLKMAWWHKCGDKELLMKKTFQKNFSVFNYFLNHRDTKHQKMFWSQNFLVVNHGCQKEQMKWKFDRLCINFFGSKVLTELIGSLEALNDLILFPIWLLNFSTNSINKFQKR